MPTVNHVGVSRKIASDEERQRLKRILTSERGEAPGGFIVRTAAEGASEEEFRADLRFLIHLWDEIKQRSESLQVARPDLPRSLAHRAHPAGPGQRQLLFHLGRLTGRLRTDRALPESLLTDLGAPVTSTPRRRRSSSTSAFRTRSRRLCAPRFGSVGRMCVVPYCRWQGWPCGLYRHPERGPDHLVSDTLPRFQCSRRRVADSP